MHFLAYTDSEFPVDEIPDICPRCRTAIRPVKHTSFVLIQESQRMHLQVVWECPRCKELFLANYWAQGGAYRLGSTEPTEYEKLSFGSIDQLSPQFVEIFNQAAEAESSGLNEISGLGYRKALEFLIKDFCIHKSPHDAEAIKKEFLGATISGRLPDNKVKLAAQKATWLGNDEAHYVRKWADHDIQDLKSLLKITLSGIQEDLEFEVLMASFDKGPTEK